jgi:hypothetical protein
MHVLASGAMLGTLVTTTIHSLTSMASEQSQTLLAKGFIYVCTFLRIFPLLRVEHLQEDAS